MVLEAQELIKIMNAQILIANEEYDSALLVLQSVKENNLDRAILKEMYYTALQESYNGLENYILGEYYLEKRYSPVDSNSTGLFKDLHYTIE